MHSGASSSAPRFTCKLRGFSGGPAWTRTRDLSLIREVKLVCSILLELAKYLQNGIFNGQWLSRPFSTFHRVAAPLLHSSFRDGEGDGIAPTDIRPAKIAIIRKALARVVGMLRVP